jgi:hypothetical protein
MSSNELQEIIIETQDLSIKEENRKELADKLSRSFNYGTASDGSTLISCNPEVSQHIVDEVYGDEYQKQKLETASKDKFGRPVRYYRQVGLDTLVDLLKNGEESALSHHDEIYSPSDPVLKDMAEYILEGRDEVVDGKATTADLVYKMFPSQTQEEVDAVFGITGEQTDWKTILDYIENNIPSDEVKKLHAVGTHNSRILKYSPYLSVCPGGPRIYPPSDSAAIIELVIPDEEVVVNNKNRQKTEREALVHRIDASSLSRIIFGEEAFIKLIQHNPDTPVGQYILQHKDEYLATAHGHWMLKTPIEDTMSV